MKKSKILILGLIAILIFSACSTQPAPEEKSSEQSTTVAKEATEKTEAESKSEAESKTEATEATGKTMVVGLHWLGSDADPANGWNGWTLTRTLSGECLVTLNQKMEVVPQLADSWEVVDDLTWKFHIRQGVKFANGKDLTAEAVKKSLERVIEKDERAKNSAKMESITVDGENIIFKTTEPYGSLLNNLTEPLFIIVDTDVDEQSIALTPVTTAPYQIVEYTPKTELKLVANPHYWDGKPGLDSYTAKVIKDSDTRAMAMQSGEIQMTQELSGNSVQMLEDSGNFEIKKAISLRVNYLGLNHNNPLLSDINLRKAMSMAINREAIAGITQGVAVGAIFPPSAGYGYDQLELEKYDLEGAKKALADNGYVDSDGDGIVEKDGQKVSFVLPIVSKHSALAEVMQAQLKEVGIEIKLEIVENSYAKLVEGNQDFDLFLTNYVTATTGDSKRFLEQNYSTEGTDNFGHYSNPKFDAVVEKLISEFDPKKRVELSIEAQQIVNDDVANIFVVSPMANIVVAKNVKNYEVSPMSYYFMSKDTTIE